MFAPDDVLAQWEADLHAVISTQVSPGVLCEGASLHLTRRQPDGVQVVTWALRSGTLNRWATAPTTRSEALQESWMQSFPLLGHEPGQQRTLPGGSQWQVYFYFGNAWSNCASSADLVEAPQPAASAPSGSKQALPDGVRMVITFADGGTLAGTVTRDIRLAP